MKDIDNEIANELEQLAPVITKAIVRLRYDHPKGVELDTEKIARENRVICNGLSKAEREGLLREGMNIINAPNVLPEFEEWWDANKKQSADGEFYCQIGNLIYTKNLTEAIYDSLKSMVRPITDEECIERVNELIRKDKTQSKTGVEGDPWQFTCVHLTLRLKPQEPVKEPWEVAWEKRAGSNYPKNHPGIGWFKDGFEAATKGGAL